MGGQLLLELVHLHGHQVLVDDPHRRSLKEVRREGGGAQLLPTSRHVRRECMGERTAAERDAALRREAVELTSDSDS